ncbi:MAG: response regulator [Desulfuromonadales bacterium]|nr:response regulator [Desulfuromonadales bacterium]
MPKAVAEILVVEDSPTQRQRLVRFLEEGGYRVCEAANGAEALGMLALRRPALVISDIMMPQMDGYTLCRRIKEDPKLCAIPVILVTYLSEIFDVLRGLEAGADNFIMKPYEQEFLLGRIRRTLLAARDGTCAPPGFSLRLEEREYIIRSDRRQVIEILLSTYETALQKNARLKAAREDLQNANEELEAFSSSVSHDLRTPLTVLSGFADFLWLDYRHRLDETGRQHLEMIREAAERMDRLIDDLLNLSLASRAEIRREPIDLSALLWQIADEIDKTQPMRQVRWQIEAGMTITGDAPLLRIAFENLLRNAWKFTSKAEQARIEAGWSPGPEPVYFIRDNGVGFDMKDSPKLFASFHRLHAKSEFPGTGIGLATVERIITRHGGRIWAEGRVGEGATFYLTLP